MKSHKFVLAAALLSFAMGGCGTKQSLPEPNEPYVDPLMEPEEAPGDLEHEAGLIISSRPSGIEIQVDGKSRGKTPITVEGLSTGEHEVSFMFAGDERTTLTVELTEGEFKKVHQSVSPDASDARVDD